MTRDEAYVVLAHALAGWSMADLDEATVEVYARFLERHDRAEAVEAVDELLVTERYFPTIADLESAVAGVRTRARNAHVRRMGARCDGSGWVPTVAGDVPCPTCAPALSLIWSDDEHRRRFGRGEPVTHILELSEQTLADRWSRPRCRRHHVDDAQGELVPTFSTGLAIARDAYLAHCRSEGRDPNPTALRTGLTVGDQT